MTRPFICIILLFIPFVSFSQINTSLDILAGIDYSYRNLNNNSILNDGETGKINFRFGFNFNKKVSEKFFFKTGLRFAAVGYKGKKNDNLRWGNQQTGGVFNPSIPGEFSSLQFIYNYLFIEIPIIGRYEFSKKKFTPFAELGLAPSLYLTTRTKQITNIDSKVFSASDPSFNKVHFVGVISFGGNYTINQGLQLFAQPTFRYHLTRLINDVPIKENLWTVGLELGFRKRLK